jgi:hypothetical protein
MIQQCFLLLIVGLLECVSVWESALGNNMYNLALPDACAPRRIIHCTHGATCWIFSFLFSRIFSSEFYWFFSHTTIKLGSATICLRNKLCFFYHQQHYSARFMAVQNLLSSMVLKSYNYY